MKRLVLLSVLFFVACIVSVAQTTPCFAMAKDGMIVQYSYLYGKNQKLMGYYVNQVEQVRVDGNKTEVTVLFKMLNKKGKPSKTAKWAGIGDGMLYKIAIEDGSYYMTMDLAFALGGQNRKGYLFKIPATLKVGDKLEGGTLSYETKALTTYETKLVYSGFKVVEELDLKTAAGTFHCFKVEGTVSGQYTGSDIESNQVFYLSPGIGIVRQEVNYYGKMIVLEASQISGL